MMGSAGPVIRHVAASVEAADPQLRGDARFMDILGRYVAELVAWGETIHLTGRGRPAEAISEQVCDSVSMLRCAEAAMTVAEIAGVVRVADIGSGAGFPGIIWKLARPDWDLNLIERRQRVAAFLLRTTAALGLDRIAVVELDARRLSGGDYDIVVSKAAGRFSSMLPLARRIGGPRSIYVTAKGSSWERELERAAGGAYIPLAVRNIAAGRGFAIALRQGTR